MQRAQDKVFTELYWLPAKTQAKAMQLVFPLSWCAVYGSTIHSQGPPASPTSSGFREASFWRRRRKAWTKGMHGR